MKSLFPCFSIRIEEIGLSLHKIGSVRHDALGKVVDSAGYKVCPLCESIKMEKIIG